MDIFLQLLLTFILIALNGFFVLGEFALVSVRITRIEELAKRGHTGAKMVLLALSDLQTYISSTQFGITLASLALGWIGEPAIAHVVGLLLEPILPPQLLFLSMHSISITIAFVLITFLQIIFGELAPKTTALHNPERFSFFIITPLIIFTSIFKPFIWLLNVSAGLLLRPFGISQNVSRSVHTEEEIKLILAQSAKSGEIDAQEVEIINRVFRIGDLPVSTIMVPKKDVIAFKSTTGIKEIAKDITEEILHTRFPIYKESLYTVIGYVSVMDMYVEAKGLQEDVQVGKSDLIHKTIFVPETTRIDDTLTLMKKTGVHLGMVIDKREKMIGIISIEDIIESLVGELKEKD
jgi:CBS domain containing-hemolysin-like protein